jgi:hydroxypyruvate reductase
MHDPFSLLKHLWNTGVSSVSGRQSVARALKRDGPFSASLVIAVGKAACSMFLGAAPCISPGTRSFVVSKYGHVDAACRASVTGQIIESGHPVPDSHSLRAGEAILQAISSAGSQGRLLLLVSGGASALVEALQPGLRLADLQSVTRKLLGSGQSIAEINEVRSGMSRIKGGRLLACFRGEEVRVYAVSDVQGDGLAIIGGGIGDPCRTSANVRASVVASNRVARNAAAEEAGRLGFTVRLNEESLYKDVAILAGEISRQLVVGGAAGVYIWGGEPTIELPPHPGTGGRNQSLALAIARHIKGTNGISVLVAGTDGTDGPTDYAGACVDGETVDVAEQAENALRNADAGTFLGRRQSLFRSGPTNTNVMDLVIATVA